MSDSLREAMKSEFWPDTTAVLLVDSTRGESPDKSLIHIGMTGKRDSDSKDITWILGVTPKDTVATLLQMVERQIKGDEEPDDGEYELYSANAVRLIVEDIHDVQATAIVAA